MGERWIPVVGFEGAYEVSDRGRVRSIPRIVLRTDGRFLRRQKQYRVLKTPPAGSGGYPEVHLGYNGRERVVTVHTLVLEAFAGPRPPHADACHADGDPTNNHLENLRWDTQSANGKDRVRHGRDWNARKAACPRRHLLVAPNIRGAEERVGRRTCKSCSRASSKASYYAARGIPFDFVQEADRQYALIMDAGTC